jgi:hypothetical protein
MCKWQGTTDPWIPGNSPLAFPTAVRESRGISPENGPYGGNLSLLSRIRSLDGQSIHGTARGARIETRFPGHAPFWNSVLST